MQHRDRFRTLRTSAALATAMAILLSAGARAADDAERGEPAAGTPLSELAGTSWRVESLEETAVVPGVNSSLAFGEDGAVTGDGGCNRYHGTIGEGETATSLSVGPLAATRMACPPERMDLEGVYRTLELCRLRLEGVR